ncbi:odorant receptor 94a-like isoform X1 [Temnothorax curvispinosus]|uniref:Odorant receptor n=1 Tax=Temnothorax curvispinosus TaxID=300111 RepID=A0A6J1QXH6_9HYME|nr:odorant receptor 94a-like isoform X1 [Temnothorax curvispinosus]
MRILNLSFIFLTICGCWRPNSWSSLHKRVAYYVYTSIIVFIMSTGTLLLIIDLILIVDNADDFCDSFLFIMDMLNSCFKVLILLINRKNIIMLIEILMKKPCKPSTSAEINIFYKFDKSIEINSWRYASLPAATILSLLLSSLFINLKKRTLMFRTWLPFDYSSTFLFYLTYIYQMIAMFAAAAVSVGCDTLICGLLVHICCQIEILTYRLRSFVSYSNVLRDSVRHHCDIFKLAFTVNERFRLAIAIQFTLTTLMICFCFYQISIATTKGKHIDMITYVATILVQNFLYCWYGNELKIKSHQMIDNIFETEWLTLDENKKKCLMIIMRRTVTPIQITCARIMPVNLETFMGLKCLIPLTTYLHKSCKIDSMGD